MAREQARTVAMGQAEKQVQALTDKYTKMADQAFEVKEKDVVQL